MAEALAKARAALGEDAVLVSARRRGGWLAGHGAYEVEAIAADKPAPREPRPAQFPRFRRPRSHPPEVALMAAELAELRRQVSQLTLRGTAPALPPEEEELYARLTRSGMEAGLARRLSSGCAASRDPEEEVVSRVAAALARPRLGSLPRVVAVVGPTGVGKTTTIAKLAAARASAGERVTLVGCDTYRVGACEQLAEYARLMGARFHVADEPYSLARRVEGLSGCVFIDTPGRGPRDAASLSRLSKLLEAASPDVVYVLVSAAQSLPSMESSVSAFKLWPRSELILTKLDEAEGFGAAVTLAFKSGMPLAYMTIGQSVPEDIVPGDGRALGALLVGRAVVEVA